jgi:hypothetical protein
MTLETYIKAIAIVLGCVIVLLGAKYAIRRMRSYRPKPMPTYVINVEDEKAIFNDLDLTTTCTTKMGNYEKLPEKLGVI